MTDIVQRLRDTIVNETPARYPEVVSAAADEIERLRTALRRIKSLEAKNVRKYAQTIAIDALLSEGKR